MNELTHKRLLEILNYDPSTGVFTWREALSSRSVVGVRAGTVIHKGYRRITVRSKFYLEHRLAWFYVHGVWPKQFIDHIDGDRTNNRIANLRDASRAANNQNIRKPNVNSTSSLLGVTWDAANYCWIAQITVARKRRYLGRFSDPQKASQAYIEAKRELHEGCMI